MSWDIIFPSTGSHETRVIYIKYMYMTCMGPGSGQGPPSSRGSRAALSQLMGLWAVHTGRNIKAGVLGEHLLSSPGPGPCNPLRLTYRRMSLEHTMKKANACMFVKQKSMRMVIDVFFKEPTRGPLLCGDFSPLQRNSGCFPIHTHIQSHNH